MATFDKAKDHISQKWIVRWRDASGQHYKTIRPKDGGKAAADQLFSWALQQEAKRRNPMINIAADDVSLRWVTNQWWASEASNWQGATRDTRASVLSNHLPDDLKIRPIQQIQAGDIQRLLREKASILQPSSVGRLRGILNLIWKWAIVEGYTSHNPVTSTKTPRKATQTSSGQVDATSVLSLSEARRIALSINPHFKELALTLASTGLRIREAAALKVGSINFDEGFIHVTGALDRATLKHRENVLKTTKTGKARKVYIPQDLLDLLRPLCEREANAWLFTGIEGGMLDVDNWRKRYWNPAVAACQFPANTHTNPHGMRHTAATTLLAAGVNPGAICEQLGWTDVRVFYSTYAGFMDEDATEIRSAITDALRS